MKWLAIGLAGWYLLGRRRPGGSTSSTSSTSAPTTPVVFSNVVLGAEDPNAEDPMDRVSVPAAEQQ